MNPCDISNTKDDFGHFLVTFSSSNLRFLGGVICFWGGVWALGALFMVALMAKNYCIKSAEAGSDLE